MSSQSSTQITRSFNPALTAYLEERLGSFDAIPPIRRDELAQVALYVRGRLSQGQPINLTFICTHNSRRSHLAQIWAHVASEWYQIKGIETFSGGTEATAFNPRAVAALQRAGLTISCANSTDKNPHYVVQTSEGAKPLICFSKVYDAPPNPTKGYCAIMTCSQADEACPIVAGCDLRIPIRYEDPKIADDTEFEAQKYDERSAQICTEMMFLMSLV
jgi:arsenate reductase